MVAIEMTAVDSQEKVAKEQVEVAECEMHAQSHLHSANHANIRVCSIAKQRHLKEGR